MWHKFYNSVVDYSKETAEVIQSNVAIFLLIFFFMNAVNMYTFIKYFQWKELCFFSIDIFVLSVIIGVLLCSPVTRLRRLLGVGLIELILLLLVICYFKGVPMNIKTVINTGAVIGMLLVLVISHKQLKYIVVSFLGVICFLDVTSIAYYKLPINSTMISFILETNMMEVYEYIMQFLGLDIIIASLATVVFCIIVYKYIRLPVIYISFVRWSMVVLITISIIINVFPFISFDYTNRFTEVIPVVRVVTSIAAAVERKRGYEEFLGNADRFTKLIYNNSKIKNIVIVLGESANRNHMNAYGYYLQTTPNVNVLQKDSNLNVFSDVISQDMATTSVMQQLFTFSNYEYADNEEYLQQNLIDIMKKAGYKTYWLSNQEFSSMFGNIEMHLSKRSDQKIFTRYRGAEQMDSAAYDEELLPLIDECLSVPDDKRFIVVHFMGSHSSYEYRYPDKYKVFTANNVNGELSESQKRTIADYDNSILYTDHILQSIFDKFKREESLIIYLSDHGENVYDVDNQLGRSAANVNRHTVEVPFFILTTDTFQQNYPEKMKLIRAAVDRPYMTDDFIHTVLDLAEIKTDKFEEKRSIVSPKYDILRKRITCGKDYDSGIK